MSEGVVKIKLKIPALVKKEAPMDEPKPEFGDLEEIVDKLAVAQTYHQLPYNEQAPTPNEFATNIPTSAWLGEPKSGTVAGSLKSEGPNMQQVLKPFPPGSKFQEYAKIAEELKELAKESGQPVILPLSLDKSAQGVIHNPKSGMVVDLDNAFIGVDLGSKDETAITVVTGPSVGDTHKLTTIEDIAKFYEIPAVLLAGTKTLKEASLKAVKLKKFHELTEVENKLVGQGIEDTLKDLNTTINEALAGGNGMGLQLDKLKKQLENSKAELTEAGTEEALSTIKDIGDLGVAAPAVPGALLNAKFMYQPVKGTTSTYYTVAIGPHLRCGARWDGGTLSVRYEGPALNGDVRNWLKAAGFKVADTYASIHVEVGDKLGPTWKSIAQRTLMSMIGAAMYNFKSPLPLFERLVQCSQQKSYGL